MRIEPMLRQLSIRTKDLTVERFTPNWAQSEMIEVVERQMTENRPVRVIVLKARQLGISTLTEGILFVRSFMYDHSHSLVIAHEMDSSDSLFGMTSLFWDSFPYRKMFEAKYASRKELTWRDTGSSIKVATAKNLRAGRGRTINALHASEVAFWDHPEELMLGMRQAVPSRPGSLIVLESTANGVGNWFYDTWNAAIEGEVEYEPLFFPWWKHPEYTATYVGVQEALSHLSEDERILKALGVEDDSLAWRRWAIRNLADGDINRFMQEYPATPEEAFIASGANVFPHESLKRVYEPEDPMRGYLLKEGDQVRFVPDRHGPLRVFKMPSADTDWGRYFVGGDPTHTTRGDNAAAQVINRRTYEQVAIWHGRIDPMGFADELAKLGAFYNWAEISTEIEGPGYATIGRLTALDYPHLWRHRWAERSPGKINETMGWSTTAKRKEWAIGHLLKLVVDGDVAIHDRRTYDEMRNYVTLDGGGYGPADGEHGYDDCVMSLAIAAICSQTDGPLKAYDGSERFKEFMEQRPAWENWGETA
jgi:hypothetical protein